VKFSGGSVPKEEGFTKRLVNMSLGCGGGGEGNEEVDVVDVVDVVEVEEGGGGGDEKLGGGGWWIGECAWRTGPSSSSLLPSTRAHRLEMRGRSW